jgi:hypothetical protein
MRTKLFTVFTETLAAPTADHTNAETLCGVGLSDVPSLWSQQQQAACSQAVRGTRNQWGVQMHGINTKCGGLPVLRDGEVSVSRELPTRSRVPRQLTAIERLSVNGHIGTTRHLLKPSFRGHTVAKLVELLCYKPEGRGFETR